MLVTLIAMICMQDYCREVVVTDSTMDNRVSISSCLVGEPQMVQWLQEHHQGWTLKRWGCVIGARRSDI